MLGSVPTPSSCVAPHPTLRARSTYPSRCEIASADSIAKRAIRGRSMPRIRKAGPLTDRAATTRPSAWRTGAATAFRPSSSSSIVCA
jgi:hypothetical protein